MQMKVGSVLVVLLTAPGILRAQLTEVSARYERATADRAAGRLTEALASLTDLAGEPSFKADAEMTSEVVTATGLYRLNVLHSSTQLPRETRSSSVKPEVQLEDG
jgi:hypothetical protein